MAVIDEIQSKQLQSILAWGSVAYVLGFLTVMVHTARLGIPIIQLLEPIYILVGVPLAVVAFFSRELWKLLKARTARLRYELQQTRAEITKIRAKQAEIKTVEEATSYLAQVLGNVLLIVMPNVTLLQLPVSALVTLVSAWWLKRYPTVAQMVYSVTRKLELITTVYRGMIEVNRYLSFVILVSVIPVGSFLYIMYLYPLVPQSFGGGKPVAAKLIIDLTKVPRNASELRSLLSEHPDSKEASSAVSKEVALLYYTEGAIYVRAHIGPTIALKRDVVNGIIWMPSAKTESN
jgi:hypothetical protein